MTGESAVVLEEGRHYAVLDKPAGVTVVKARGVPGKTLLDLAEDRYGKGVRPVHRLDKPTTGCCVIARTEFGQQALSDAFRRHIVDKRYLAVVKGVPPWTKMAVDARLLRVDRPEAKKGPLAVQTVDDSGKRALTRVRVLAKGEGIALVEARPETGRMHQIRVHLAHVGFPLLADPLYGDPADDDEQLLLHAFAISFPSPDGGRRFVTAPVPKPMSDRLRAAGIDVTSILAQERERFLKPMTERPPPRTAERQPSRPAERSTRPREKPTRAGERPKSAAGTSTRPAEKSKRPGEKRTRPGEKRKRPSDKPKRSEEQPKRATGAKESPRPPSARGKKKAAVRRRR